MSKRANGEGSVFDFVQKVKNKKPTLPICDVCKDCGHQELCNYRENCSTKCAKCKSCTLCLTKGKCDRYYIYERHASQCSTKDGKRTPMQYGKNKRDAAKKNLEIINKLNDNIYTDKSKITLYEIAKDIIEDKHSKNITNDNSYIANCSKLKRLNSHRFVHIPIQEITDRQIHEYLNSLVIYSQSVISKDYGLLNTTFRKAVRKKIIGINPLDDKDEFRMPRSKKPFEKVKAFTIKEQQLFVNAIRNYTGPYKYAWLLSLFTGMRPGEVYALNKNDIDFEDNVIHIVTTLTKDDSGNVMMGDRTKTYSGTRDLTMDSNSRLILEESILLSDKSSPLLFPHKNNNYVSISASNSSFKRFCDSNGIGKGFAETQYVLRHSFATRKIESGTPAEVLKTLLGHKDIEITLNTYFDAFAEYKNKYTEQSYNYNQDNNLNYAQMDFKQIKLREIDNLLLSVKNSHLNGSDKNELLYNLAQIKQTYLNNINSEEAS